LMFALSKSVPPDNTLGLSHVALEAAYRGASAVLYLVTAYAIPAAARRLARKMSADMRTAARLILTARLTATLVIPLLATLIMHEGCLSTWLRVWKPCTGQDSFSASIYTTEINGFQYSAPVVRHSEICTPAYSHAECPRGVIDVLGGLLTSKLAFSAFCGAPISLLLALPQVRTAKAWVKRMVTGGNAENHNSAEVDCEVAGIVMFVDLALVLGFCVPCIIPLCALALLLHAAVFNLCVVKFGIKLTDKAKPESRYLWLSLTLGWALTLWFFVETGLQGQWLVGLAAPLLAAGAVYISRRLRWFESMNIENCEFEDEKHHEGDESPRGKEADDKNPGKGQPAEIVLTAMNPLAQAAMHSAEEDERVIGTIVI